MGGGQEEPGEVPAEKRVDESWKSSVQEEKTKGDSPATGRTREPLPSEPDFSEFISSLGMQALVALGEVPHPLSRETKTDLYQARYLIDTIELLSKKTRGNLSAEEALMTKELLYELRMKFVRKSGAA
ncbi:MAG: DUF1844 domain-containing protein [Candidatus Omnitrophica bacterium]|nr:DUF1844 domain-containing protein [Candidatus Omnitrophota bacterium]